MPPRRRFAAPRSPSGHLFAAQPTEETTSAQPGRHGNGKRMGLCVSIHVKLPPSSLRLKSSSSSAFHIFREGPGRCGRDLFFWRFGVSGGLSRAATPKVASGKGALFSPRRATAGHGEKSWTEAWGILRSDNPAHDAFPQSAHVGVAPRIAPVSFSRRNINRSEEQTSCRSGDSSRRCFVRSV